MMPRDEILWKVIEIIARKREIPGDTIGAETRLVADLGLDSFDAAELLFEVEDAFEIKMAHADLPKLETVDHVVTCVAKLIGAGSAG